MFSAFEDLINQPESAENIPEELPILPLRGTVAFPFVIIPLSIGVPRSVKLIKSAVQNDNLVGLVVSKEPELEEPEPDQLHENYDFVHCTNYWTSWNNELVLRKEALEALLARELRYVGSKYPLCSISDCVNSSVVDGQSMPVKS